MANVCERWSILVKDILHRKKLSYSCDLSTDISSIAEVLTAAPALHSLTIYGRDDVADILEFLNRREGDLRKLILKHCNIFEDGNGLLANIVALYPDLEVLSLRGSFLLTSDGFCLIAQLKKLSELNLKYCSPYLSGETVRFIADNCQHLKNLNLDGVELCDDDLIHVIDRLGKQLTALVLDGQKLTDVVFSYLKNCARLQYLELSRCENMTDRGLPEGIGSLQELTSLHLFRCYSLTPQTYSTLFHQTSMSSIESLGLCDCSNLDDEVLKGIAERCIHLKELYVGKWCENITDAGISMVVSRCSQLRVLSLANLKSITGEGWLALVPSHLPHLRRLCLVGCSKVCTKYVEELVAAAPELVVVDCMGDYVRAMRNKQLETY